LSNGASGSWLSDWITAAATAATALFAAITGWAAMQAYRHEVKRDLPVVESDFRWSTEGEIGPHSRLRFTILNRLDETLVVQECEIKKPKRNTISTGIISSNGIVPSRGVSQRIRLDYNVYRSGTLSSGPPGGGSVSSDLLPFLIFLSPPDDWHRGEIVTQLLISSKASTIRNKRIVIRTMMPAVTHMHQDCNCSSGRFMLPRKMLLPWTQ
jgi:hypothetical protein